MPKSTNAEDTKVAAVEVLEELTEQEVAERHRLEIKVERAFVEAGVALRSLRDLRLYRSTHKTFEEYCQDRFGYSRISAYHKITAAEVVENLLTNSYQNQADEVREELLTKSHQILPTKETQVRPLAKLEPQEQRSVWQQAVVSAGGRIPTERLVKAEVLRHLGIVERLKEKHPIPATESYKIGDVFELTALSGAERKYNGCWAIATGIMNFTLEVEVHDAVLVMKSDHLNPIDSPDLRRQLPSILKRIKQLRQCDLDRGAYTLLESFGQHTYLTDLEAKLLNFLEQEYEID